jgi:U32 family peptidase
VPLAQAENRPLTTERLRDQLGRLGGTPFHLDSLENQLDGNVIVAVSELNRMRRKFVEELEALRSRPKRWQLNSEPLTHLTGALADSASESTEQTFPHEPNDVNGGVRQSKDAAELIVLVRNLGQLETVLRSSVKTVYCEFEDPKKYREAVAMVRAHNNCDCTNSTEPVEVFVAPPRIFKTGEEWILKQVHSSEADGYLVRNYDHLNFFKAERCVGDFSLNVANSLAAEYFVSRFGLERVTASYDLNGVQLEALLKSALPAWFEITIHQHMPMFHMEHCVFCAFLSSGTDYRNCGRPCDTQVVKLRDRVGAEHPLKADAGCRNTVFNSMAQTGAESTRRFLALGARSFRVEFLNESPEEVARTIEQYRKLLSGEISGTELWKELKLLNQLLP